MKMSLRTASGETLPHAFTTGNGNRTECSPVRSVVIPSGKQYQICFHE